MKRPLLAVLASVLLTCLAADSGQAQTLQRIRPEASSPGYPVVIDGIGLGSTTHLRFSAFVGGFVGVMRVEVPVTSVSATRVSAVVPNVSGWIPPGSFQSGDPLGSVQTVNNSVEPPVFSTNSEDFYFFEGSAGFLSNAGTGTTLPTGLGRPVISFSLPNFPPAPGNPLFTVLLENATPGALPIFGVGLPTAPPHIPIGDGTLVLQPGFIFAREAAEIVSASGDANLNVPIPAISGITLAMQWGYQDPLSGAIQLSNAMIVSY